ncbi:MAG: membrane protein insertion efficiency factor YidD [Deltaproteobacteria bacterium]|nr:membrane protein insertion efficiency factor YidD [Deltaproteobacteria bacterium]
MFLALFSSCFGLNQAWCGENSGPKTGPARTNNEVNRNESTSNIGAWFASSVWRHISAVDGQRCPSEPTCSSYSAQAFRKHGFFVGWVMTVDRLIHEADEGRCSPVVKRNGDFKILDPVENNDFWWYSKDEEQD